MSARILVCTVGGSHEPVLRSVLESSADFVLFLCTGRDPATGQPGSRVQVDGKGSVIKAQRQDPRPSLPNIPAQAGLTAERFQVAELPADDLDAGVAAIRAALDGLAARFPGARWVADYTGGTKTMSAALVVAALEREDMVLQLVSGNRADLVQVRSGMESVTPVGVEGIRTRRAMQPFLDAWARYAYGEAAAGLARLRAVDSGLRAELNLARDLSRAFDAWDRFDHAAARGLLELYRPRLGQSLVGHLDALKSLCADADPRQEPARLFDLWRNAQRRSAQGRYDDAVARVYRLIEWLGQWLLRSRCGMDTADIPADRLPADMPLQPDADGRIRGGLMVAWDLVGRLTEGPAASFIKAQRPALLHHLEVRNHSILAHGFTPIGEGAWRALAQWLEGGLIPVLEQEAAAAGLRRPPPQLPERLPVVGDGRS